MDMEIGKGSVKLALSCRWYIDLLRKETESWVVWWSWNVEVIGVGYKMEIIVLVVEDGDGDSHSCMVVIEVKTEGTSWGLSSTTVLLPLLHTLAHRSSRGCGGGGGSVVLQQQLKDQPTLHGPQDYADEGRERESHHPSTPTCRAMKTLDQTPSSYKRRVLTNCILSQENKIPAKYTRWIEFVYGYKSFVL